MKQVVIENPILNSPFEEPSRHFRFTDEGITDDIDDGRRESAYFIPVPPPKKKGQADTQMALPETHWTRDRLKPNDDINRIRTHVGLWRRAGYRGVTATTAKLLAHWNDPTRERKLFFCQREAVETVIYLTEIAERDQNVWILNRLRDYNRDANPELFRMALKIATAGGKTTVMAMLIAWHTLNKQANKQDARFSDTFLIVTPGITIRDRLRVLLPSDPDNYYRKWDLAPPDLMQQLLQAKVLITNFHAFKLREKVSLNKTGKAVMQGTDAKPPSFTETPDEMVRRVCRDLGNKKNIVVINDEAHHCYRHKPDGAEEVLKGEDRKEAQKREEAARIWISGIEAVKRKIGVRMVYDLSATPFFLRGSGYPEGMLFPWVVSDFALIDAIESGIVKVPRVPVADDSMIGEQPTYRDLWYRIREGLPKKGRGTEAVAGEPVLPAELESALQSLYANYKKRFTAWQASRDGNNSHSTPPVFIVVCNNTNVSKLVFDYVSGWEKPLPDGDSVLVPGHLELFSNVENGAWSARPKTILIDSEQLDSGEAMSDEFRKVAAVEIDEFKREYADRFPGRDVEKIGSEDLLREVMNTVGKPGKLGEQVRCVVSVSMLTEGWDANTVTHILGVRAFGTQLLCEQVVGRALRRISYAANDEGKLEPEYAEIYGVPFSFIPCAGAQKEPPPGPTPTRVRALSERIDCEITFPRLQGYRYDFHDAELHATFTRDSRMALSTDDVPTKVENAPIVGETTIHTLDELKARRPQEVAFLLAKLVLERYFRWDGVVQPENKSEHKWEAGVKAWLFPQVLRIAKDWMAECVVCKDNCFPQMLLLLEFAHGAANRIYHAIVQGDQGEKTLKPILFPYDPEGSTRYVDFDTTRPVYSTRPDKCHVSHVAADTKDWEQKVARSLEDMDEVVCYVKNQNLGFKIPYVASGEPRNYVPDYIVRINDGAPEPLNLIIEVTGEKRPDKAEKVAAARALWVPAVNNHGGFGRWAFLEVDDPANVKNAIRDSIPALSEG